TSTPAAPWRILESTDKLHARVKALRTINKALEDRLG
ncbi:MAG: UDP-galactose-lipid carrier transferase, partial [Slackia sp.]|nr:UDP-galactose-lipid carrier transferase [Slackia sp.]